jgi:alanyl-tRNA synthetase
MSMSGAEIRKSFIDFFIGHGHTFVPSASLVPGGDQTLLFTNAGMVQFKDLFLGIDHRPYSRAVNSQKCLRVAGKHNDLDEVGRDDTHHTFFEMLGNWSFGDYYKKEAVSWAWQLLTDVWGLPKESLWATCFKDDKGNISTDEEAAGFWRMQPGFIPDHQLFFGRKDNFWEMADTGPCGPCSEIHIDRGPEFCNKKNVPGHVCQVNGDCQRFLELWNLVFIQYNRLSPTQLEPLPATHVDTGMGFERIVSVLQNVNSNYRTDLLFPLIQTVQNLTGHNDSQRDDLFTPYRVIADHSRSAAFLIADGVVPGNTGRNYVCRMIIRRAARFGSKIGLTEPFLAKIAQKVIDIYGDAYPELRKNQAQILDNLTREEIRFRKTVDAGIEHLDELLEELRKSGETILNGRKAFDLYATHGLPLELTRDIARENGLDVDEVGFRSAMEEHRLVSGGGKAFGPLGGEDVDIYRSLLEDLVFRGLIANGVRHDPYSHIEIESSILAFVRDGESVTACAAGDLVEVLLPETCFYVESGGQVSDNGWIIGSENDWQIDITEMRKPAAGVITHVGKVIRGAPRVGEKAIARVDANRRQDIMRNHTATHLLHAELHKILGEHARQAGSLVAPDRLRFDFTHPEPMTAEQLEKVEAGVNHEILENQQLSIVQKPLQQAMAEGATALFGEKYGDVVRTITIGEMEDPYSYELCGGTHVGETGDIGSFIIMSEGSTASGIRRIEAVTGRKAYEIIQQRMKALKKTALILNTSIDEVIDRAEIMVSEAEAGRKQIQKLRQDLASMEFGEVLGKAILINGVAILTAILKMADVDTLRQMTDRFRQKYPSGVVVLATIVDGKPAIIANVTDDLVKRGIHAGELIKQIASVVDGSGGGRPNLAQAGGKDPEKISEALSLVEPLVRQKLS